MRVLLLFRGSAGCGKSTWIKNNFLKRYSLSADDIRLLCHSPMESPNGECTISLKNDNIVWNVLFQILEVRLSKGEFTVIDANNSKTSEMNRYKDLAKKYRYRIFCVDFTYIPIEVVKERNRNRLPKFKIVPDVEIDKMYARFKTQKIPSGITVIKPDELYKIWYKKIDFTNKYDKIHVYGDIHGCYTVLTESLLSQYGEDDIVRKYDINNYSLMSTLLNDNELYIFCGDYIDRGIENEKVVKFLLEIYNKPNVILLEGNHEIHLRNWANDISSYSRDFEFKTKLELDNIVSKKEVRKLCNKIAQCAYFDFNDKTYIVTHGGLSSLPPYSLTYIPTDQMIRGVGNYEDYLECYETFMNSTSSNTYQIHGHRNTKMVDILNGRNINLESRVEFGGNFRFVTISKDSIECNEIKNNVFRKEEKDNDKLYSSVADAVMDMKQNEYIKVKEFENNISSFNFSSRAFYDKAWNYQTIKARGLYIDTNKMKVFARSYDKFFNIDEVEETKFKNLCNMSFPVTAYVKENGFLSIISYNEYNNDLFITTKSDPNAIFADILRSDFYELVSEENAEKIKEYLKTHDVSFVLENCDSKNDPHMIKYEEKKLFLLDIIYNDLEYKKYDYEEVCKLAKEFGLDVKEKAYVINTWQEFYDWYNEITVDSWKYNGSYIEGFVIEDSEGFMTKIKLQYYNFWKFMRNKVVQPTVSKGYILNTEDLRGELDNLFYGWLKDYIVRFKEKYGSLKYFPRNNIIKLREKFYEETGIKEK